MTQPLRVRLVRAALLAAPLALAVLTQAACPSPDARSEAIDPVTLPQEVRADYEVFAQRCSKCHSLARPLNSGIVDDDYWKMYVARMRRQPGSGISLEDSGVILRFLHFYSLEQIRKKQAHDVAPPAAAPAPAPAPASERGGDAG